MSNQHQTSQSTIHSFRFRFRTSRLPFSFSHFATWIRPCCKPANEPRARHRRAYPPGWMDPLPAAGPGPGPGPGPGLASPTSYCRRDLPRAALLLRCTWPWPWRPLLAVIYSSPFHSTPCSPPLHSSTAPHAASTCRTSPCRERQANHS
jgi:hypothetical protein